MRADHKGWKALLTLILLAALVAAIAVFLPGATGHGLPPPLSRRATLTPPDRARLALAATALGTALLAAR